jgi:hypothetical protein
MLQQRGRLFDLYDRTPGSWLVVTTNGALDGSGNLVMGAGVAGAAKRRWPGIEGALGERVRTGGNVPFALPRVRVLTWPTKPAVHDLGNGAGHPGWMCVARISDPQCLRAVKVLTARSGLAVRDLVDSLTGSGAMMSDAVIFTPRPGCGLGGLDWRELEPWMAQNFSDRFVVVDPVR